MIGTNNAIPWILRQIRKMIPFIKDLFPKSSTDAVCGENNGPGRILNITDSTSITDLVGKRDGVVMADWAYDINAEQTIGVIETDTAFSYARYVISKWVNGVNTAVFANGTTKRTYINGVFSSSVSDSTPLTAIALDGGYNYMIIIIDGNNLTAQQIDDFENQNACLFYTDNWNRDTHLYHSYTCQHKSGTTAFDNGTDIPNHGITKVDGAVAEVNALTKYNPNILNAANKDGYNIAAYLNGITSWLGITPITLRTNEVWNLSFFTNIVAGASTQRIMGNSNAAKMRLSLLSSNVLYLQTDSGQYIGYVGDFFNGSIQKCIISCDGYHNITISTALATSTKTFNPSTITIDRLGVIGDSDTLSGFMKGLLFGIRKNNIMIEPLNGSVSIIESNIDWNNIILPFPDQFGRKNYTSGLIKLNAEIDHATGVVDFFPPSQGGGQGYSIGYIAHAIMNLAAHDGNLQGFTPYWTADVIPFITDWDHTYRVPAEVLNNLDTYMNAAGKRYIYANDGEVLKRILIYANQKTTAESTAVNNRKYKPTYS